MDLHINKDIRTSYLIFPKCFQPFLTWLTGKPLRNQEPLLILGPYFHFFCPLFMFISGIVGILCITPYLNSIFSWMIILIFWLVILSAGRKFALTVRHQCIHYAFTGSKKLDILFAEIATTLLCTQDANTYQIDHANLHHRMGLLAGVKDPHVKVLFKHGFKPGMTKSALWRHLLITLISPIFHYSYTMERIKYNFIRAKLYRRMASVCFWIGIMYFFIEEKISMLDFILAYFIPVIILYNNSALLEIISEHPFYPTSDKTKNQETHTHKTWGIMCGSPLPNHNLKGMLKVQAWLLWIVKMIGHFIVRTTILCGDLSAHDLHHLRPLRYDWRISIYERQKFIDNNAHSTPIYRDVWGFINAIDLVFASYAKYFGIIDPKHEKLENVIVSLT